jgi:hypothetical protein
VEVVELEGVEFVGRGLRAGGVAETECVDRCLEGQLKMVSFSEKMIGGANFLIRGYCERNVDFGVVVSV